MKMDCVRLYSNWAKKDFATPAICIRAFYKYIEDLELCGVGLSCEASVELLAQNKTNRLPPLYN